MIEVPNFLLDKTSMERVLPTRPTATRAGITAPKVTQTEVGTLWQKGSDFPLHHGGLFGIISGPFHGQPNPDLIQRLAIKGIWG